jgi:hypothetical protein
MKSSWYSVRLLDRDGRTISEDDTRTLYAGKRNASAMLADTEYRDAWKVEVRRETADGELVWDKFKYLAVHREVQS